MDSDLYVTTAQTHARRQRKGRHCTVHTVYSVDGALLSSTKNVVDWWREYFDDLLNPLGTDSSE